jgi:SAM-dependent methyltransferase
MQKVENFAEEIAAGERFEFGRNWAKFLATVDDVRIDEAMNSLRTLLSVACTRELKRRERATDESWCVMQGSVLDEAFLGALGQFDVVYSWGVLHHTGAMWRAIENARKLVRPGGRLCIAIYNDQGRQSAVWLSIKRTYNRLPRTMNWLVSLPVLAWLWTPTMVRDLLRGKPLQTWKSYAENRGMSPWHDLVDWVGGLPFEVAAPDAVFRFLDERGFRLIFLKTCGGGIGCNEYTFVREHA